MLDALAHTTPKLLIVDDSRTMRQIVKRTCLMCGVEAQDILEAADGVEALEVIDSHRPSVMLCD
ncbi:MAG: hypothetical protein AAGI01_18020, partial [Myxococcota bacterium]